MMKEIKIESVNLSILSDGGNVLVKSDMENVILPNQNIDTVAKLIEHNFNVVVGYYKLMIQKGEKEFDYEDVTLVSISIVLYYLYMYNSWRSMYKKQDNKDLRFNERDFSNSSTHDMIFNYFKSKYPIDWEEKCAVLLGMELSELKAYYKTRDNFYNK